MLRGSLAVVVALLALAGTWLLVRDGGEPPAVVEARGEAAIVATEPPTELVAPRAAEATERTEVTAPLVWTPPGARKVGERSGKLVVTVRNAAGEPIQGAVVLLVTKDSAAVLDLVDRGFSSPPVKGFFSSGTFDVDPDTIRGGVRRTIHPPGREPGLPAKTDADGRFVLTDLPFFEVMVCASFPDRTLARSDPIALDEEHPEAQVELVLVERGGLFGSLLDIEGRPAAGVEVSASPTWSWDWSAWTGQTTDARKRTTDDDGRFRFADLDAGTWALGVKARPGEAPVPALNLRVEVLPGRWVAAHFPDPSATGVQVEGYVLLDGERPRSGGISVYAGGLHGDLVATSPLNDRGEFRITLLDSGRYHIEVGFSAFARFGAPFEVEIPPVRHHALVLEYRTTSLTGTVRGPDGRVVRNATVTLVPEIRSRGNSGSGRAETTDERGSYAFTALREGSYSIHAEASRLPDPGPYVGELQLDGVFLRSQSVPLILDLDLPATGDLTGTVVREDGRVVDGARIEVRDAHAPSVLMSDAAGRFDLRGHVSGLCWVRASRDRATSAWTRVAVAPRGSTSVELTLHPGATVRVEVADAEGPVQEAKVTLVSGDEITALTTTVRDGWALVYAVPPGSYRVTARRDADDVATTTATIAAGEETVVRLRVP